METQFHLILGFFSVLPAVLIAFAFAAVKGTESRKAATSH